MAARAAIAAEGQWDLLWGAVLRSMGTGKRALVKQGNVVGAKAIVCGFAYKPFL